MEKKLNICPYMIDLTPNIILSKPQLGENIGSTARAMKNFGIEKLRLIEPRDGWPNSSARKSYWRVWYSKRPRQGRRAGRR